LKKFFTYLAIGSLFGIGAGLLLASRKGKGGGLFKGKWDKFWEKAIYGVVAHEGGNSEVGGSGKNYTDLHDNDNKGGTAGICHFASGGLADLYRAMPTEKLFGKSKEHMIKHYADSNSGAYNNKWWRDGMSLWLNNPANNKIQIDVCRKKRQDAVDTAIKEGNWRTDRQLAIAVGISNSYGNGGFRNKARARNWDAERILNEYVNKFGAGHSGHKERRKKLIDKWFPINKQKNMI
tara:strand:+ start:1500 stop:2204 length:705 start_codon:yes stop_codon:yes gene_type:complete